MKESIENPARLGLRHTKVMAEFSESMGAEHYNFLTIHTI